MAINFVDNLLPTNYRLKPVKMSDRSFYCVDISCLVVCFLPVSGEAGSGVCFCVGVKLAQSVLGRNSKNKLRR